MRNCRIDYNSFLCFMVQRRKKTREVLERGVFNFDIQKPDRIIGLYVI